MSGAAWNPKNKTAEEQFQEAIMKNEYYDLEPPTLKEYKSKEWEKLEVKPSGMYPNWSWNIKMDKQYKELYGE